MTFNPGQSGNPAGRPPKNRALTEILEKAGSVTVEMEDGRKLARKRLLAQHLWDAVTTGQIFGHDLKPDEYLGLAKLIYSQVDGPPKQEIGLDATVQQGPVVFIPEETE